jgi:1,4-dihydroxy-2-naphthoate octaprenyltransferase
MITTIAKPARAWFWASRPFSLSASVVPVALGTAMAAAVVDLDWLLFSFALAGSVLIQVGTNLTDEYTDHRRSGGEAKFLAPHKVIARGMLSERAVLLGLIISFAVGIGMGLYIVSQVGWPILAVGIASVLVAYLYSAGPYPLGNLGLGEPIVFFFMGPLMVMAAYYVQVEEMAWPVLWASMPVALLVTSIMHCNNLRDIDEDRREGKRTLASLMGPGPARWTYAGMLAAAYGTIVALALADIIDLLGLLGLVALPWAAVLAMRVWRATERPAFNRSLVNGAKLHALTGLSVAVGLGIHAGLES